MKILFFLMFTFFVNTMSAQTSSGNFFNTEDVQQSRAYSHGVFLRPGEEHIMTSGIIGTDKNGTLVTTSARAQIRQAFENIRAILVRAGADVDDIIEIETFLVDTANFLDYALERRDFFKGRSVSPPISKTYYAKALINPKAVVELAVSAKIPDRGSKAEIVVTAVVRAKPGKATELRRALFTNVDPTRKEDGCISYELFESLDEPGIFTLHERWKSRDALKKHFDMPYMKALSSKGRELIEKSEIFVVNEIKN